MRKYLIVGNWKMYGSKTSVTELLDKLKKGILGEPIPERRNINTQSISRIDEAQAQSSRGVYERVEWAVLPPFPFLDLTSQLLSKTEIMWGGQNLSEHASGAYTGEVAASMLKDFACTYVLVGHSERRQYYHENDELIAAKFKIACETGLKPILCIGETLKEREQNLTHQVIAKQLDKILNTENLLEHLKNAVIAYEPVWAIGTGLTATPEQAQDVHAFIRQKVAEVAPKLASNLVILYGGSVKPSNAQDLFAMPDINGGLIGGASLKAEDFIAIGAACNC